MKSQIKASATNKRCKRPQQISWLCYATPKKQIWVISSSTAKFRHSGFFRRWFAVNDDLFLSSKSGKHFFVCFPFSGSVGKFVFRFRFLRSRCACLSKILFFTKNCLIRMTFSTCSQTPKPVLKILSTPEVFQNGQLLPKKLGRFRGLPCRSLLVRFK